MATELTPLQKIEARQAINDLNTDFCQFLDHGRLIELVDLFTEDAYYAHGERVTRGRDEIRDLFERRSAKGVRTARHMYGSLKVELITADQATGQSVCMTFAADALPPIVPASVYLVADFNDEYVRCSDGRWRIAKRQIERIFMDPDNAGPVGQK